MSNAGTKTSNQDQRTTTIVAIGTFLALSLITLGGWAFTRKAAPEQAPQPVAAAAAVAAPTADEHVHAEDFERISIAEAKAAWDRNEITIIDVRPMEAFMASHIPGALHIPVARIEGEIPYLPKEKTIVTYCTCPAEESSGQAAMILARGGIKAKALQGGFEEWTRLGYATGAGVQ